MKTYAKKGDIEILVTKENINKLVGYEFIQKELTQEDKIINDFNQTIEKMTTGYTQAEISSWSIKKNEAEKVIAGGKSSILNSLLIKGETVLQLAKKIIAKAKAFEKIYFKAEQIKRTALLNKTIIKKPKIKIVGVNIKKPAKKPAPKNYTPPKI